LTVKPGGGVSRTAIASTSSVERAEDGTTAMLTGNQYQANASVIAAKTSTAEPAERPFGSLGAGDCELMTYMQPDRWLITNSFLIAT
jgi:cell division protein FtsI/penicillin-binding protein 2